MKLVAAIASLATVLAAQPPATVEGRHARDLADFDLGTMAGSCLVVRCEIFRGIMLTELPRSGEAVAVKVTEHLFGEPRANETELVPYDDREVKSGIGGTARAWGRVHVSPRDPVTVLMAQESGPGVYAGQPALVTFDERETNLIRLVSDEALRLRRAPEIISGEVGALSPNSNPALAGYLMCYVMFSSNMPRRGLAAELLLQMIGSPGIPSERWVGIPQLLIAYSAGSPPEQRAAVIQRFAELAAQENENAARAGFAGLRMIAGQADNPLRSLIAPSMLGVLGARYRSLVGKRIVDRSEPLDALLGFK
jgi:hypothetical protein